MNDAYALGYSAFQDGVDLADNPYEDGSDDHDSWEAGWLSGVDEERAKE